MNTSKWKWVYNLMNHEVLEMDSVHGLPVSSLPVYGKVEWTNNEDVTGKFVVYQKDHAIPIKKEEPIVDEENYKQKTGIYNFINKDDERIKELLEKEPVNFFLVNILRCLSPENMKILSDTLIARLPKKDISDKELEDLAKKVFPKFHLLDKHDWNNLKDGFIEGYKQASSIPIIDKGEEKAKDIYAEMGKQLSELLNINWGTPEKLDGYECALWDLQLTIQDMYAIQLDTISINKLKNKK